MHCERTISHFPSRGGPYFLDVHILFGDFKAQERRDYVSNTQCVAELKVGLLTDLVDTNIFAINRPKFIFGCYPRISA